MNAEEEYDEECDDKALASKIGYEDSQDEANVEDKDQVNYKIQNTDNDTSVVGGAGPRGL